MSLKSHKNKYLRFENWGGGPTAVYKARVRFPDVEDNYLRFENWGGARARQPFTKPGFDSRMSRNNTSDLRIAEGSPSVSRSPLWELAGSRSMPRTANTTAEPHPTPQPPRAGSPLSTTPASLRVTPRTLQTRRASPSLCSLPLAFRSETAHAVRTCVALGCSPPQASSSCSSRRTFFCCRSHRTPRPLWTFRRSRVRGR